MSVQPRFTKEKNKFFKQLDILYKELYFSEEISGSEKNSYSPAIAVYALLDRVIPYLISSFNEGRFEFDQHSKNIELTALLTALKQVKLFPDIRAFIYSNDDFFECHEFNDYVQRVQTGREKIPFHYSHSNYQDDTRFFSFSANGFAETFLKAYIEWRLDKSQLRQNGFQFDFEKEANQHSVFLREEIYPKIESILTQVGFLYVVAFKVTVYSNQADDFDLNHMINLFENFGCLSEIKYVMALNYSFTKDWESYYVVCLVQNKSSATNGNKIAENLVEVIRKEIETLSFKSLSIDVESLNDKFRLLDSSMSNDKPFVIDTENVGSEFLNNSVFSLTENLLNFGRLSPIHITSKQRSENPDNSDIFYWITKLVNLTPHQPESKKRPLSNKNVIWIECNALDNYQSLWTLLHCSKRSKLIWDYQHLSENSKEYLTQASMVAAEQMAIWGLSKFTELVIKIEIFVLTFMQSSLLGFHSIDNAYRMKRGRSPVSFENVTSRHLLQFAEILKQTELLAELEGKLEGKIVSKTLGHFFSVFRNHIDDTYSSGLLQHFLYLDLESEKNQEKIDGLLAEYQFSEMLFFHPKKIIETNQSVLPSKSESKEKVEKDVIETDVNRSSALSIGCKDSTNSLFIDVAPLHRSINTKQIIDEVEGQSHHLLHMQRHKSRLIKVKDMLYFAMRQDVVIIRCLFSEKSKDKITQQDLSKIFSNMLQVNKKSLPFSFITGYLGYWEGVERTASNKILGFAANVLFVFNAQVLTQCPDLLDALTEAWQKSCRNYGLEKRDSDCIDGVVEQLKLAYSVPELNSTQLILETTHKKLAKIFIHHVAPIAVYQDLLDDEIYQILPKWLIKKNVKTSPSKTAKLKKTKT